MVDWLDERHHTIVGGKKADDDDDPVPGTLYVGWKPSRLLDMNPALLEAIPLKILLEFFRTDAEICHVMGARWSEEGYETFCRCLEV